MPQNNQLLSKMNANNDFSIVCDAWKNKDPLTLNEAAALWAEETPPPNWVDDPDDPRYNPDILPVHAFKKPELFKVILEKLCTAIRDYRIAEGMPHEEGTEETRKVFEKTLKPDAFNPANVFDTDGSDTGDVDSYSPNSRITTVTRNALAMYALQTEQNPYFLKKEMDALVPFLQRTPDVPPYFNHELKYHSRELKIAVETWLHFFEEGNFDSTRATVPQIKEYLKKNFSEQLSTEGINRLSTVINPDIKKAGRTRKE